MRVLGLLGALIMLVFWFSILVAVIGTATVAATSAGGPLVGLLVFALLVGNAYIWGGWEERK